MKGSSNELQEVSLLALINDPYLLSKCIPEIKEEYFENPHFKIIYKCVKNYYNKYGVVPAVRELVLNLQEVSNLDEYGTKEDIEATITRLYDQKITSDDFMYEKVTEFIRRNRIESSINKVADFINNGNIDLDRVADELRDSIYINFNRTESVNLADVANIREIKREALGSTDSPVIVKFFIDKVNDCMQYKGLIPGTMNMICLVGDTKVICTDGTYTIEDLYNMYNTFRIRRKVLSAKIITDGSRVRMEAVATDYESVAITGYVNETVVLNLNNGNKIECTPNHKFMCTDFNYYEASELKEGSELLTISTIGNFTTKVIVESIENKTYDDQIPVYDIINVGDTHNFAINISDNNKMVGVFSHNCAPPGRGKTTMMINQGVSVAQQGYKLLHIFLGDMSKYDGFIRYVSCFTGISSTKLVQMSEDDFIKLVQKYNMTGFMSNIDIVSYAADQLTTNQLIEEINNIQRNNHVHYNVIIVDYDENLAGEDESMYKSGGQIYNKLALFAVTNKSVVFILSQPRKEYWDKEIIPLEAASESSKKQKIIDMMITLGKPSKNSTVGTLYLAKNRRGEDSKVFRISIDGSNAQMKHIYEEEYIRRRQEDNRAT